MNKYNVKLPMNTIKQAVKVLNEARQELKKLDNDKAKYSNPDAIRHYSQEHIEHELVRISAEKAEISNEIMKKISGFTETIQNELKAAFIPNGSDLLGAENEADAALFHNGLILDAKTLDYMVNKHDNAAFRILAANYARARKWENFDYITSEEKATEYVDEIIKGLNNVAAVPFGYDALRFTETKGEFRRMANKYGLLSEFDISDGNAVDSAVIEPLNDVVSG